MKNKINETYGSTFIDGNNFDLAWTFLILRETSSPKFIHVFYRKKVEDCRSTVKNLTMAPKYRNYSKICWIKGILSNTVYVTHICYVFILLIYKTYSSKNKIFYEFGPLSWNLLWRHTYKPIKARLTSVKML